MSARDLCTRLSITSLLIQSGKQMVVSCCMERAEDESHN